jgi:Flp pilus assembly protein TadG
MVSIKNILLFVASVSAAALIRRDASTVDQDLQKINTDTTALRRNINSYNGGALNALPIQNAQSTLANDIKRGTSDAQNSQTANDQDAQSIIDFINHVVITTTPTTTNETQFIRRC